MAAGDPMSTPLLSAEDERAVIATLTDYATAADTKDRALLETCFAQGASGEFGEMGSFASRQEVIDGVMGLVVTCGPSMHCLSNFTIRADGDGATSRCYMQAVVNVPGMEGAIRTAGVYEDRLVREDGRWRILRRTYSQIG